MTKNSVVLTIPTSHKREKQSFETLAKELIKATPTPSQFQAVRVKVLRSKDNLVRAAVMLLADLLEHGWRAQLRGGRVYCKLVDSSTAADSREKIRARLNIARTHQLRSNAVKEFLQGVEKRRLHAGRWTSIFSLMRDGRELAESMKRLREGSTSFEEVLDPYLQIVTPDAVCEHTGFPLVSIWRYFRHTWSVPYNSVPGRSLMFLVRDAAAPRHPIIGIAALASSAVQLSVRDAWIGWAPETVVERLRTSASDEDLKWLERLIKVGVSELYLDDLFDPNVGPLRPKHILNPTEEVIKWLNEYAIAERETHHRNSDPRLHKDGSSANIEGPEKWIRQAETPLFRSKRAETLAVYLRAKKVLINDGKLISIDTFAKYLQSPKCRQAIQSLIRRAKSERVGIAMADISVCGAVAPYSLLLGGKLVSMLAVSPEVVTAYAQRYCRAESVIASSLAGRAITRPSNLVFIGTTSLYGSEPNQYTRTSVPCSIVGGKGAENIRYVLLGKTEGYGTFHFSDDCVESMATAVAETRRGQRVNSIFGEGVNPRLRKIRDGLDLLGLNSDTMLMHGSPRLIYGVPLTSNFRQYLLGYETEPKYLFSLGDPAIATRSISRWWAERWLKHRIERDDILAQVAQHRLTYPIRHGARVELPEEDNAPRLNFDGCLDGSDA